MSIAVDLDGTLAEYHRFEGNHIIGAPVPAMFFRVEKWIEEGEEVIIFTARAENRESIKVVHDWLKFHGLPRLQVTNIKLKSFQEMWDDRAISVERNTGKLNGTPDWWKSL